MYKSLKHLEALHVAPTAEVRTSRLSYDYNRILTLQLGLPKIHCLSLGFGALEYNPASSQLGRFRIHFASTLTPFWIPKIRSRISRRYMGCRRIASMHGRYVYSDPRMSYLIHGRHKKGLWDTSWICGCQNYGSFWVP